jgi:hypothetical protein
VLGINFSSDDVKVGAFDRVSHGSQIGGDLRGLVCGEIQDRARLACRTCRSSSSGNESSWDWRNHSDPSLLNSAR